ncbi:restriction endonuclease subunit S [Alphaproteobacteria bacterium KMM 3653]|uniref:Restriction endonuclease subunit S n=1 Tax=Harenicola maris TaxID=2841044 RepID=A0AAP2CS61_9RHOB|nr:restriction endonuclease subunit S [Harenicola maris]
MKAGWEVKPLGEVCDFKGGSQPPKSHFISEPRDGYIRMLQIRDFKSDDKAVYIPVTPKTNACEAEDIMIGRYGASVGQIHRGKAGAYNVALIRTIPDLNQIDRDFLYHYLTSDLFQKPLMSVSKRGAQDGFSKPDIAPFPFPIPPLEEQERIVAVLDAAFEGLTRAKENVEANLQNARELFENHLASIFEHEKSSTGSTLGDAVAILTGYAFKSAEYSEDPNDMAMVRGDNIVQGQFRWKNVKRWPVARCGEFEKFRLDANDVLLAMDRTWVKDGIKYAIVNDADLPLLLVQRVARLRCLDNLNNEYLGHFIGSKKFERYVLSIQTGMGVPHISGQQIKDCPIYLPDISVQNRLAVELSAMRLKIEALETDYRTKLTDIGDLRQSLLQKAFAGELT